jgi:hypothetical protein
MKLSLSTSIDATPAKVWSIISDIEHAADHIQGIDKVEVLEKPKSGLKGLKWRETRTMFGKEATEVMWITEAKVNSHYLTRAESHGAIYVSGLSIAKDGEGCTLTMSFEGTPVTFGAKVMWALTGWMAKGAMKKALNQDLADIKAAAEA